MIAYEPIPLEINMDTWRRMSKNDIIKTIKSQQMRKDFEYMTHSEILTRIERMQKSAKYLSEKFGVNHLLPPPSMSNGHVEHNHPPLDSLLSLVMPMNDPSMSASNSIHFPPIATSTTKQNHQNQNHYQQDEGDESSVISNFSSNIPHYVSRSEILKVYDVLPAHKNQISKEKRKSNNRNDRNYKVIDEEDNNPHRVEKEKHLVKQHGSWSSRASSIMHNPESIYISREEVLRNFQNSNGDRLVNGNKQNQAKRIHDSWSSRASSILAKVNEGQEPTYVSRSQLIGNITGNKKKTTSREEVLRNLEAAIAEGAGDEADEMGSHTSEGSSSTLSDPDTGSEASTVKNVRLKSRVELPDRMKENDANKRVDKENTREGNDGKLAKNQHTNLPFDNEKKNNRRLRNTQHEDSLDELDNENRNVDIENEFGDLSKSSASEVKPRKTSVEKNHVKVTRNGRNNADYVAREENDRNEDKPTDEREEYAHYKKNSNSRTNKNKNITPFYKRSENGVKVKSSGTSGSFNVTQDDDANNNSVNDNQNTDFSSYDINNHSDDGASSFCSCSSCEYYTDCSCCPDESIRELHSKTGGNDAEREEDEEENQLYSVTTTNSSVDTVFELGRDKGNKNITKVIKTHKDVYIVNGSPGGSEKSKNSSKLIGKISSINYDPIPKHLGSDGKGSSVKQMQLLALKNESQISPLLSDEPRLIKKIENLSSLKTTQARKKSNVGVENEKNIQEEEHIEQNPENGVKGSWSNADFQKIYEPVNVGEIRKQQNRRALKRYLKELAVEWDHAIDDLNTLRRGQVLKELRYYIKEAVNVDTAKSPEDIGKQVEIALREALTSNFEAISNVNIGQMYVPMEENPTNSKAVSRENTDYDTFGSIDSLIFEPKIPTHEDIKEAQEEIEHHFEYLDDLDGSTSLYKGSITGPGKTTFADRVRLFQNLESRKPKLLPPIEKPPTKKITFLDIQGQETSWKEVANARKKSSDTDSSKASNSSSKNQSNKWNPSDDDRTKHFAKSIETLAQKPVASCNESMCNCAESSYRGEHSLAHEGQCSMCECNCAQCLEDPYDHEKDLHLESSEREPTSGHPTSCNFSSGAVSWAFLGNNNPENQEEKEESRNLKKRSKGNKQEKTVVDQTKVSESRKSPQKDLRLQLKEAFGASFPLINDEASNVLSSNYLQAQDIELGEKLNESKDSDTLIYSSEIELNVDHGIDFLSEYAMRKDLFEDSLSHDNSPILLKGGKVMHLTQESFRGELGNSLKMMRKEKQVIDGDMNGVERNSRADDNKNKKSSSEMGDSGIGSPPPAQTTILNESNTIIVEVQIEHQEVTRKTPSRQDVVQGALSPEGFTNNGSDSGLEDNQQHWRGDSRGPVNHPENCEEDNFLLQIKRHEFAEQIKTSVKTRKLDAKKEPDTMIRELKTKLKQKFNAPSTANSSVASRSAESENSSNRKLITFLDGIKSENTQKIQINEVISPKEVYESSFYDDSSLSDGENNDASGNKEDSSRGPFKRNSNFTPPPTENNSSRCSSRSPMTPRVVSHARGTALLPPIPDESTLECMMGFQNRNNGKALKLSAKDKHELLYGPGGMFGPKGPFSTPSVRYPGGLEVNMPIPTITNIPNFPSNSRFLQRGVNFNRKSPSNKAFHSELSSVAEDRSDGRSQIVANSIFAFTNTAESSRPQSGGCYEDVNIDNENHDKNSLTASTTLILEGASSSASKPPSRMEPYRFCELVGEAARVNIEMGHFENSSDDLEDHWREDKTERMMAWINGNSQLNDLWASSQYSWSKVSYLQPTKEN